MNKDYYPSSSYYSPYFEFVEWQGKLAVTLGWNVDNDTPRYYRDLRVSHLSVKKWALENHLGDRVTDWNGNIGKLRQPINGAYFIDVTEWEQVREYKPIPKPRANRSMGRRYNWVWVPGYFGGYEGRWVKQYDRNLG